MAYISQITLPNNSTYNLKDSRVDNLGTAAEKDFTTSITSDSTDLPTAGAVYTAIQNSTPTETDPTVPAWAKASTKPSYNASEINGAVRVDGSYGSPVYAYGVYGLTSTGTTQIPAYSATITNDNQVTTKKYVDDAISGISGLQHILDGSATGSVRTLRSQTEGSTYYIGDNQFEYTMGEDAFAEGYQTIAASYSAHAEGTNSIASGDTSHAEGEESIASGFAAHAEGYGSTASGDHSHAEGQGTQALGTNSHAEGLSTRATNQSQHVFGEYNVLDPNNGTTSLKGTYIQIVGNGTSNSTRSNARTLDWSGNETLAGKLTLGANAIAAMDAVTYQQLQERTPVTLCTYSSDPKGDGTETQFQITHGLNTTNVFVSVNITDTNGTYIAPLTSVQASAEIGYRVKIINANKIEVTFTAAPGTGAAVVNVFASISNYINADNVSY